MVPTDSDNEKSIQIDDHVYDRHSHHDDKVPNTTATATLEIPFYTIIFFVAMVGHELAVEAASTEFGHLLDALPYGVTLFQFAFCLLLPILLSRGKVLQTLPTTLTECRPFCLLSSIVFGGTALASMSLRYVSYPTKVVFKSTKLIPTMVLSTAVHGTRHGATDYLAALLLCAGAAGYSGSSVESTTHNNRFGLLLLIFSVLCDALVPNLQQKLMAPVSEMIYDGDADGLLKSTSPSSCSGLSPMELMTNVNAVGVVGLIIFMSISGHLASVIGACIEYPRLALYLTFVGLGLAIAVLAYTKLIQISGSVVAVSVSTLRKMVTVGLSYVVFPKVMLPIHYFSGILVLAGILLSARNHKRAQFYAGNCGVATT